MLSLSIAARIREYAIEKLPVRSNPVCVFAKLYYRYLNCCQAPFCAPILTLRMVWIFANWIRLQELHFAAPLVIDFLLVQLFLRLRNLKLCLVYWSDISKLPLLSLYLRILSSHRPKALAISPRRSSTSRQSPIAGSLRALACLQPLWIQYIRSEKAQIPSCCFSFFFQFLAFRYDFAAAARITGLREWDFSRELPAFEE